MRPPELDEDEGDGDEDRDGMYSTVGFSDYDVFFLNVRGPRLYRFLANWALEFQEGACMTYRYQDNAEFDTDFETVEKNLKNLLTKKLNTNKVCKIGVCPVLYYQLAKVFGK